MPALAVDSNGLGCTEGRRPLSGDRLAELHQPIEGVEGPLAPSEFALVESPAVLGRNEHRKGSMIALDEEALPGRGRVEDPTQAAPQFKGSDPLDSHSQI